MAGSGRPNLVEQIRSSKLLPVAFVTALVVISLARLPSYLNYTRGSFVTNNDLTPDYVSAKEWRAGGDPYAHLPPLYAKHLSEGDAKPAALFVPAQRNAHTPALILLLAPLSFLSPYGARLVWFVVSAVAMALAIYLFCREIGLSARARLSIVAMSLALPIVGFELQWAQFNGVLLLAMVAAWIDLRRGRETRAGVVLGAVTAFKIFPAFLLIPLLRGKHRLAVRSGAVTAVAVSVAGAAAIGIGDSMTFLKEASGENLRIWAAAKNGISLFSMPFRWLAPGSLRDPSAAIPVAVWLLAFLGLALCVTAAWQTRAGVSGDRFWAAAPWMILASPLAWNHYLVLLIPFAILLVRAWPGLSSVGKVMLVPIIVLMGVGQPLGQLFPAPSGVDLFYSDELRAASAAVTAALLAAGLIDLRERKKRVTKWGRSARWHSRTAGRS